jgi:hypothetical protein
MLQFTAGLVHFVMTYNFTLNSLALKNENFNILELLPVYSMVIDLTKPVARYFKLLLVLAVDR